MNILLTGESGYFDRHAVVLAQLGRKVLLDNLSNSSSIVYAHPQYQLSDGNHPQHQSTPMDKLSYMLRKCSKAHSVFRVNPPKIWPVHD